MRIYVLALLVLCTSASAQGQTTGNDYSRGCRAFISAEPGSQNVPLLQAGECIGVMLALKRIGRFLIDDAKYCVPDPVTLEQMARVVVAGMDRLPQHTHEDFVFLATGFLRNTWPCRSR